MRRWNGWGDDTIEVALGESALDFLRGQIGAGTAPRDAAFDALCASLPPGRLPSHPLVDATPQTRLMHAAGQSLQDWLRLRYGRIVAAPDAVAFPESGADVRALLRWAADHDAAVVPYGGGTSVAGHLDAVGARPTLCVDMTRMRALVSIDADAQLAVFEAGVAGPDLEAQLRAHGYTLGHFPQSFDYSTLGGWVVTRSSGQQSLRYGRIEQLFAGGRVETPAGPLAIPTFPASAAGPDLRELVLGSEGRLGILTEAAVRISRLPAYEAFHAVFFPDWTAAERAVRAIVQARLGLSMLRVSNAVETATMLTLAGHGRQVALLETWLKLRGAGADKCMLLVGASGEKAQARAALKSALTLARSDGGVHVGQGLGERWKRNRFRNVYLRNSAWAQGYAIDTVETALDWPRVTPAMRAIERAAHDAFARRHGHEHERVHAYTHLSHLYPQGASVYSTFIWRLAGDYDADLARWRELKTAVSEAIVASGGTISHQHGVGRDHAPWLAHEKGELGMAALRTLFREFDPDGRMNPGKLVTP